jgi:hypothetical protein
MALVHTDPVSAKAIALHTEVVLAEMRACTAIALLEKIYTGYLAYAGKEHVCGQIREHVQIAFNEMATLIKAREKEQARQQAQRGASRMTGEANPC